MIRAHELARNIRKQYWFEETLPININLIAERMGINVSLVPSIQGNAYISGMIDYEDDKAIISINKYESEYRRRFTLAHELGHYVMSHGKSFRDQTNDIYNRQSTDEIEANAFAAELLMPKFIIDYLIDQKNITSPTELANKFGVSRQAMIYRMANLGWIPQYMVEQHIYEN